VNALDKVSDCVMVNGGEKERGARGVGQWMDYCLGDYCVIFLYFVFESCILCIFLCFYLFFICCLQRC
jgi:hypothetical protein